MADQAEVNEQGNVMISGFVKGNCINPNQLVHITGYDDYQIEKIDILAMGTRTKLAMQVENADNEELSMFTTVPEDLNPFSKPEAEDEDILSAIKGLQLEEEESKQLEPEQEDASMNEEEEEESEVNWESESDEEEGNKADEKAKRVQMQMRTEDELEFEDEVEYAAE